MCICKTVPIHTRHTCVCVYIMYMNMFVIRSERVITLTEESILIGMDNGDVRDTVLLLDICDIWIWSVEDEDKVQYIRTFLPIQIRACSHTYVRTPGNDKTHVKCQSVVILSLYLSLVRARAFSLSGLSLSSLALALSLTHVHRTKIPQSVNLSCMTTT